MHYRVTYEVWIHELKDFFPLPLDDADPATLALANKINGRDLSQIEYEQILRECGVVPSSRY